jgi:hypothetical protein
MRIKRDIIDKLKSLPLSTTGQCKLPTVRILLGPRQCGKTTLLDELSDYKLVSLDDLSIREFASSNPAHFLNQFTGPIILDEAALSPELFFEIKKRVDDSKRQALKNLPFEKFDYWITGSNQTLMSKNVQESMAGRAQHFHLNTLSIHETQEFSIEKIIMKGGWPELHAYKETNPVHYLNDLISTFIERDIMQAAGVEKKAAFHKTIKLLAGSVGEVLNFSSLSSLIGVESPTVQSWSLILEQNKLIKILPAYMNNINKRLIKMPKIYFEDIGLAIRLQGWSEFLPIIGSPNYGHIIENVAYSEISRFITNEIIDINIYYLRTKEKIEVDFLIELPNKRYIAAEVKTTPRDFSREQLGLIDSLKLNIIDRWILTPEESDLKFENRRVVSFNKIYKELLAYI